jgi:hypothetical protein
MNGSVGGRVHYLRVLTYAAKVVVILMGAAGSRQTTIGRALAETLGWPLVDAHAPEALHLAVARTLGRREHLVATSAPLSPTDQDTVRGDLYGVRFVDLTDQRDGPEEIVGAIQREFGL